MISFERLDIQKVDWENVYAVGEINIFQTCAWLAFIAETEKAEPVVASVKSDGNLVGYFTGLMVHRYGMKILGSPFRGWGTYFMGFNLKQGVSRDEVLQVFPKFAFKDLGCNYLEIIDPNLVYDGEKGLSYPYNVEALCWYAFDLTKSEDEILANMSDSRRKNIRRSIKKGVVIEEANDIEFMDEYYAQFTETMKKHSMAPLYDIEYLRILFKRFFPTGNLLLLRARDADGLCISTQIYLSLNKVAIGWGAASWRKCLNLCPNEPLDWYGVKYMKARGMRILHVGGAAEDYKKWMGCVHVNIHRLKKAKYAPLDSLLNIVTSPQNSVYRSLMLRKL